MTRSLIIATSLLWAAIPAQSAAEGPMSCEIYIQPRGKKFDKNAHRRLREAIAEALVNGKIRKYEAYSYDKDGGEHSCVERPIDKKNLPGFYKLIEDLKRLGYDVQTTSYTVTPSQTSC